MEFEDKKKITFREHFVSAVDKVLSGNPLNRLLLLAIFALLCVCFAGSVRFLLVGPTIGGSLWFALVSFLDPGFFAEESTFAGSVSGIFSSLLGLFIVACLVGLVASAIEERLNLLSKGRSRVTTSDHIGNLLLYKYNSISSLFSLSLFPLLFSSLSLV